MATESTILVADDEDVVLNFVTIVLQRAGFRVLAASSAAAALALTNQGAESLDLALLDVVMPKMDGPGLSAELRRSYPDLRVLFMSGFSDEEVNQRCGARTDFLKKPFTSAKLLECVREAIERPRTFSA